jgi:hypothetical protein
MDIMGNPVRGETVTFSPPLNIDYGGGNYTSTPALKNFSAVTNEDGIATVRFIPPAYVPPGNPGYKSAVTGTCKLTATWNGISQDVTLTWKNYPYISISTTVDPATVKLNETVDVNIKLRGDGWALTSSPIDVVLVMDRSGSMSSDTPTRLSSAKTAAKTFVDQMSPSNDRVGVVSYAGYTAGTATRTDTVLTSNQNSVKNAIDSLAANGATETRAALKQAIDLIRANPRPDPGIDQKTVKAIILMTDGDYNYIGTPLAKGTGWPQTNPDYTFSTSTIEPNNYRYYSGLGGTLTTYQSCFDTNCHWVRVGVNWVNQCDRECDTLEKCLDGVFTSQNMSVYAISGNIRIYTISFASTTISQQARNDMRTLSVSTGGFYQHAPDAAALVNTYKQIAGELKKEAGVDTQVLTDFGLVTVNNESVPGDQVFEYIPDPGLPSSPVAKSTGSTWIHLFNNSADIYTGLVSQQESWTANHSLIFNVGTIKVNETWESTFRLKVLKEGNVDIFGNRSLIRFNDTMATGIETLFFPPTLITVSRNQTSMGFVGKVITLSGLASTDTGEIRDYLHLKWNTSYTGSNSVSERIYYRVNNGPWYKFEDKSGIVSGGGEATQYSQLDIRKLPPGGYQVKIEASAPDTPDAVPAYLPFPIVIGGTGKSFIKLE